MAAPVWRGAVTPQVRGRVAIWFTQSVLRCCSAGCAPWLGSASRLLVGVASALLTSRGHHTH
jgi:hypothetical protein